ncbi:MAG TPA: hypothetical protein VGR27_08690, partial [Longimicrobiaceae bacterium]|nr:hypothetical protein [Longimicrobiaceae bacterium]
DVHRLAAEFREPRIPCDVLGLEPGWQTRAYSCSFVWSERFPDPRASIHTGCFAGAGIPLRCHKPLENGILWAVVG